MRTKQEIKQAIAILNHKADRLSLLMAEVLHTRLTEQQVFQKYVVSVDEASRDEAAFFAARDAARFLAGHIGLEELIPDAKEYNLSDDVIVVSSDLIHVLINKIESLERKIETLVPPKTKCTAYLNVCNATNDDLITQEKAYKYIGCSKVTLKSWTDKGLVQGYRKGAHVYYSKSELNSSPTVQNFKNIDPK